MAVYPFDVTRNPTTEKGAQEKNFIDVSVQTALELVFRQLSNFVNMAKNRGKQ